MSLVAVTNGCLYGRWRDVPTPFILEIIMPLIHGRIESTRANGPGERAIIHFAGCHKMSCADVCWNPDTHAFDESKRVSIEEMEEWFKRLPEDNTGITFSGGEPMHHVVDLYSLCYLYKRIYPDRSVGMYTGYTEKELDKGKFYVQETEFHDEDKSKFWNGIANHIDFAIMGRYNPLLQTDQKPLCGSSNQEIVLFSDRYKQEDFAGPQYIEFTVGDGLVQLTGFPVGIHDKIDEAFNGA
jgi:anaerobic ribonucleoside-triphosphate reductase activating protein